MTDLVNPARFVVLSVLLGLALNVCWLAWVLLSPGRGDSTEDTQATHYAKAWTLFLENNSATFGSSRTWADTARPHVERLNHEHKELWKGMVREELAWLAKQREQAGEYNDTALSGLYLRKYLRACQFASELGVFE